MLQPSEQDVQPAFDTTAPYGEGSALAAPQALIRPAALYPQAVESPQFPLVPVSPRPRTNLNSSFSENSPEPLATLEAPLEVVTSPTPNKRSFESPFKDAYAKHMPLLIAVVLLGLGFIGYGGWAILQSRGNAGPTQITIVGKADVSVPDELQLASGQVVVSKVPLQVNNTTQLNGSLTVTGETLIQGITVAGATILQNGLAVQGNSVLAGDLSAINITATGNVNVAGTITAQNIQGQFSGVFTGNGSGLTGIRFPAIPDQTCKDCVKLLPIGASAQTGNIALNGNAAIAGTINASQQSIRSGVNNTRAFSVQAADGSDVLVADTSNGSVKLANILPQQSGTIQLGAINAAITVQSISSRSNASEIDSIKGTDGLIRSIVRSSGNTGSDTYLIRCLDTACTSKVETLIFSDTTTAEYPVGMSLDSGNNPYVLLYKYSLITYETVTVKVMHCTDQDCIQKITQTVLSAPLKVADFSISSNNLGMATIAYSTFDQNIAELFYMTCADLSCSSFSTTKIVDNNTIQSIYNPRVTIGKDGFARITYVSYDNDDYEQHEMYVRCTAANCATKVTTELSINSNNYFETKLASDGMLRIVYQDSQSLYYAACIDQDCVSINSAPVTAVSGYVRLALALTQNDRPIIAHTLGYSYSNPANEAIQYIYCPDTLCQNVVSRQVIKTNPNSLSLNIAGDNIPRIIYYLADGSKSTKNTATVYNLLGIDSLPTAGGVNTATAVGSLNDRFGAIYGQSINLHTATQQPALVVNQESVVSATSAQFEIQGPVVDFQLDGKSAFSINKNATTLIGSKLPITDTQIYYKTAPTTLAPYTLDSNATTINVSPYSLSSEIQLPFDINYFGNERNAFFVTGDGVLSFSKKPCMYVNISAKLSQSGQCSDRIYANATYTETPQLATVKYQVFGIAPHRTLVIDWNGIRPFLCPSGSSHFQLHVTEDRSGLGNNISVHTIDAATSCSSYTFGQGLISPDSKVLISSPLLDAVSAQIVGAQSYTPMYKLYNAGHGNLAIEKDLFAGGNIFAASGVEAKKVSADFLNGRTSIEDNNTTGVTTPGLNATWYNGDSVNYRTVGSGTIGNQSISTLGGGTFAGSVTSPLYWPNITNPNGRPAGINESNINVRWTGWIRADKTGTYVFSTYSDDGSRIYIDNQLVVNNWLDQGGTERRGEIELIAGNWYQIEAHYFQGGGGATFQARWQIPGTPDQVVIDTTYLSATKPKGLISAGSKLQVQSDASFAGKVQDTAGTGSYINFADALSGGAVNVKTRSAANVGLTAQGSVGQTGDLLQAQSSTGAVLARIDAGGNLTVRNATINGHIITGNFSGTTTATVASGAGTGASCTVSGNDTSGKITLTTGTAAFSGPLQCTINFANAFTAAPTPVVSQANGTDTSAVRPWFDANTTSLSVNFQVTDTSQKTYRFNYFNAQ